MGKELNEKLDIRYLVKVVDQLLKETRVSEDKEYVFFNPTKEVDENGDEFGYHRYELSSLIWDMSNHVRELYAIKSNMEINFITKNYIDEVHKKIVINWGE
jgi:hypothetical protein